MHGTAFYLARTDALSATDPFAVATTYRDGAIASSTVKPHDLRQQFGGTLGGAAVRDRLFYFYAFDGQQRGFAGISSPGDPAFYSLSAMQRALLANRGVSAAKINAALNYLDSLTGRVDRRDDQTIHFLKLDWQAAKRHRLSVQYNRLRSAVPAGLRGAPVVDRGVASLGSGETKTDSIAGRWTWAISPHLFNELRLAHGRDLEFEQPQTPLPQEPAIGPGGFAPEIAIAPDGFSFGTPAGVGRQAYPDEQRTQLIETAAWSFGHHLLQLGVEGSTAHDEVSALSNTVGTFRYDSGTTNGRAGGLVDWITDYTFNVSAYPNGGCPTIYAAVHLFCFESFTQSFGRQSVAWTTRDVAGFVQETWRPRATLSISAGLRYEYELLPLPQQPDAALDAAFSDRAATSIFPEDRNNFGPRLGVAWSPFGRRGGVIRLGYGVYYGRVTGATVRSALVNTALPASSLHIRITPQAVTACPQMPTQGFGYVCSYLATPPAAVASTTSATVFSRRFRTPMVQQGSLALEHSLGGGIVASASYLINLDRQLQGSVDLNIAPATQTMTYRLVGGTGRTGVRNGEQFVLPVYTSRLVSNFGPVTAITSGVGASYHALVLEATRRSRAGLEFRASWTWSKAIDEAQSAGGSPAVNAQLDPFNLRYDKGLSRLNFPHKAVVSAVWSPRVAGGDSLLLRRAFNGWTASAIFYETAGRPYSYEISGGDNLSGGHSTINNAGGAIYLPTVGRDTLRLPDTARLDLRIARVVHLSERVALHATVEAFNLFNRVNLTGVEQRAFLTGTASAGVMPLIYQDAATVAAEGLNTRPFGTYTAAGTSNTRERQLQLGLRMEF
ncbi:MAG: TonB-dependent receptor [Edaphobacter sp.]|uniref:TonB-dependent receptor n=1 Tax=Edaphobacter sp. TaxID=1934404 RepID=UPI0023A2CA07|nr:TonB-dependent receptor [Edaphobacter sp.]MDE1176745.1 TonB-dependent receptor [Edaphobacter sp.]